MPNITAVNALGDFEIAADRLAIIDGEGPWPAVARVWFELLTLLFVVFAWGCVVDPWRPDTPHSEYAEEREDTLLRPFKIIPSAFYASDPFPPSPTYKYHLTSSHLPVIVFALRCLLLWSARLIFVPTCAHTHTSHLPSPLLLLF